MTDNDTYPQEMTWDSADSEFVICDHLGRRWALGQCLMCGGDDGYESSGVAS